MAIWLWTRARFARLLRKDPSRIPADWSFWPRFQLWPLQRQGDTVDTSTFSTLLNAAAAAATPIAVRLY